MQVSVSPVSVRESISYVCNSVCPFSRTALCVLANHIRDQLNISFTRYTTKTAFTAGVSCIYICHIISSFVISFCNFRKQRQRYDACCKDISLFNHNLAYLECMRLLNEYKVPGVSQTLSLFVGFVKFSSGPTSCISQHAAGHEPSTVPKSALHFLQCPRFLTSAPYCFLSTPICKATVHGPFLCFYTQNFTHMCTHRSTVYTKDSPSILMAPVHSCSYLISQLRGSSKKCRYRSTFLVNVHIEHGEWGEM